MVSLQLHASPPQEADVEAIVALVCACDVEELGAPDYDAAALRAEWSEPGVEVERDGVLLHDDDGALVGYGVLLGEDARAWVHPGRRGAGAGSRLAAALESRARRRGLTRLVQQVAPVVPAGRALLERRGYSLVRRYGRWALEAGAASRLPVAGWPIRRLELPADRAAVDLAAEVLAASGLRPEPRGALLARDATARSWWVAEEHGLVLGVALAELRDDGDGHVAEVAVVPAARGRGLARALTAAAAGDLARRGAGRVVLWVRSDNPAALATYAALGFGGPWHADELALELPAAA